MEEYLTREQIDALKSMVNQLVEERGEKLEVTCESVCYMLKVEMGVFKR